MGAFRVAVLASGTGTNLQAILDEVHGRDGIEVACVASNKPEAMALRRAADAGIETAVFERSDHADRADGRSRETPAGLTLVDTGRWQARKIEASTTDAALASGTLLASCFVCDSGGGLTGFSLGGRRKFHLFGSAPLTGVQPLGRTALVGSLRGSTLIDARSGRRLRRFERFAMTLLGGDAPFLG